MNSGKNRLPADACELAPADCVLEVADHAPVPARGPCQSWMRLVSTAGLVLSILLCIYGLHSGIFTSQDKLQRFIAGFGLAGVAVFILFQAVQVVLPILPGGIGCLAGVLLFGAWKGFFYNYIGICGGSILAFLIAKSYGKADSEI